MIGGGVAVVVALPILPLNPVRVVHRAAGPTLDLFAHQMTVASEVLTRGDADRAEAVLRRLRAAEVERRQTTEIVAAAREMAMPSPWPWPWPWRALLRRYEHAAEHLELAFTNSRNMVRRMVSLLEAREPVPPDLPLAIEHFGQALRLLHRDFLAGGTPDIARTRALEAAAEVQRARTAGLGCSGTIVVSQVCIVVSELLQASGLPKGEADRMAGLHVRH
ncbi:hypothetical protein GA0070560_10961 [Micromonospora halophytica]|uniref:Uncharacterized protein n=1 Tax=Micromonospora halophytica TaxID=47864 RepID=A0A1C5IAT8_9ACTN|nr:hypothetical protein GA0070560_10961 [Micromonospora halophytica]